MYFDVVASVVEAVVGGVVCVAVCDVVSSVECVMVCEAWVDDDVVLSGDAVVGRWDEGCVVRVVREVVSCVELVVRRVV